MFSGIALLIASWIALQIAPQSASQIALWIPLWDCSPDYYLGLLSGLLF